MIITVWLITVKKHTTPPYVPCSREWLSQLWFLYMMEYSKATKMTMWQSIHWHWKMSLIQLSEKILDNVFNTCSLILFWISENMYVCICIYVYVCIYVHMSINSGFSEKWDGDCFQQKSIWSLTLVETSEDPLVLAHLGFLTPPAIPGLVVSCSGCFRPSQAGFWLLL